MIATTLTGQLSLLMLIEMAERAGISVVSGNTDGVMFHVPRHLYDGLDRDRPRASVLADVTGEWERITGFDLEFGEYRSIHNQSVNSYFAIRADGSHKRKGPLGNPWSPDPCDFDIRSQLMKNPQATICSDAALARIKHGTAVAETIRACRDIRQFVTLIKATGGATWKDEPLGKTVRFYWSTAGRPDPQDDAPPHDRERPEGAEDGRLPSRAWIFRPSSRATSTTRATRRRRKTSSPTSDSTATSRRRGNASASRKPTGAGFSRPGRRRHERPVHSMRL